MHVRKSLNRFFNSLRRKTKEGEVDDHGFDSVENRNHTPPADVNLDSTSKKEYDDIDGENDNDDDSSENMKAGYTRWKSVMKRKSNLKKQKWKENERNVQPKQEQEQKQHQQKQWQLNHHHNNNSPSTTRFSFMRRKDQSLSRCQLFEVDTEIENEESGNSDFDYEFSPTQKQCEYICSEQKTKQKKKTEKTRHANILQVKADICAVSLPNNKNGEMEIDENCYDNKEFSIDSENTTTTDRIMTTMQPLLMEEINYSTGKSTYYDSQKNETIQQQQQQQLLFEKEMDAIVASSSSSLPCRCNAAKRVSINKAMPFTEPYSSHKVKNTTVSLFSKKRIVLLSMQKSAKRVKKALKEGFIAWGESISYASAVMPQLYATDYPAMASQNHDEYDYAYAPNYQQKPKPKPSRETQQQQRQHIQLYTQQAAPTNFALQCNHANHHSQLAY